MACLLHTDVNYGLYQQMICAVDFCVVAQAMSLDICTLLSARLLCSPWQIISTALRVRPLRTLYALYEAWASVPKACHPPF